MFVYPLIGWLIAWWLGGWSWLFAYNVGMFVTYYTDGYHGDEVKYMLFAGWQLSLILPFKKRIFNWIEEKEYNWITDEHELDVEWDYGMV